MLGKDAEKELDGIAKVSFDMGKTWVTQNDATHSKNLSTEFWTYDEYEAYAKAVEKDLVEMLTANEPNLTQEDVEDWKAETSKMLKFIKAGGEISKNILDEDSELVISSNSTVIEIQKEKK